MRYFRVDVTSKGEMRVPDDLPDLHEQLGRRAVVSADTSQRRRVELDGGWATRFPVFVFARDNRTGEAEARDLALEAFGIWEIGDAGDVKVREAALTDDICHYGGWSSLGNGTVLQKGNLFELHDFLRSREVFRDWIVGERPRREDCFEAARATGYARSLADELHRMFDSIDPGEPGAGGAQVPAHYLVEGCSRVDCREAVEVLLEGLLLAGRLPSTHAFHVNFDAMNRARPSGPDGESMLRRVNESLARALAGNVVVLEYGRLDEGGSYDELAYGAFRRCVEVLRPHLASTLVVLAVPDGKPDLAVRARKLTGAPLVAIRPDGAGDPRAMSPEGAWERLEKRAAADGAVPDARLREMLSERMADAGFSDLDGLYEDWRRERLVEGSFPAYRPELDASLALRMLQEPDALTRLDEMVGLSQVKQQVKDILARFKMNREAAHAGLPVQPFSMHMAFVGAPGTGKTEVARLYGEILKEAGVLAEGRVVIASGTRIGKVTELFDRARGSVLFVDEAYAMAGWSDTVAEFIACMEDRRADTVVILAGYENEIEALVSSNPGFRSRIGFTLKFPEYTPAELLEIYQLMCARARLRLTPDAHREARDLLARNGRRADQGNARYARKLFEDTLGAQQVRLARRSEAGADLSAAELSEIRAGDVIAAGKPGNAQAGPSGRERLASLVGLTEVKRLVAERVDLMRMQRARRDAGLPATAVPLHLAFLGAPGTGKTEVARCLGRILREEGVLSVGDFHELTGNKLLSPMEGVSSELVRDLFARARGSVVFIDEAYSLMEGARSGTEAITAIVDEMERLRDEVVVVFAGYKNEVNALLEANPGFASRVGARIEFPDYTPAELLEVLGHMAEAQELRIGDEVREKTLEILERAAKTENFGNARFARNLLESALLRQSSRLAAAHANGLAPGADELRELLAADFEWKAPSVRPAVGFSAR